MRKFPRLEYHKKMARNVLGTESVADREKKALTIEKKWMPWRGNCQFFFIKKS